MRQRCADSGKDAQRQILSEPGAERAYDAQPRQFVVVHVRQEKGREYHSSLFRFPFAVDSSNNQATRLSIPSLQRQRCLRSSQATQSSCSYWSFCRVLTFEVLGIGSSTGSCCPK